jgi:hypothetical protein
MNEPGSHGDGRPLAANVEEQSRISPDKATTPTSVQNLPLISCDQGSLPSLPFHVAIANGGLEIAARIKSEGDAENLIQIRQTIKPLLQKIYGRQPSTLPDPPDPPDIGDHAQRTDKEAETGMSFFITKAQKAELRRLGYSEEQIRAMKPEEVHRALGLIS